MKRIPALLVVLLFIVTSCNLGMIEEIQVKGEPEYQIPAGLLSLDTKTFTFTVI